MKRKLFTVIALTLCVLMTALCLTACGGKESNDVEADGTKSALLGAWSSVEAEGTGYTFGEDGKGTWDLGDGLTTNFTYVDNGTSVEITYEGTSVAQIWEYAIDGNNLTMTDTDTGSVLTYTKK